MLHEILLFFVACFFSAVLVQTVKVNTLAGNGHSRSDLFPSTRWSVVLAAGRSQAEPEISQAALAELCQTYWAPLYSFVRSRGYTVHDAQDLTQSFFAYLLEHKIYARVDRQKGKFRSFLLAAGLERLSADYKGESKEKLFNELRIFVAGGADRLPTYAELTDRLGIAESTLRSHVTRLRARYLEALRAEVRRTVPTETQVDEELRELIHVLTEG